MSKHDDAMVGRIRAVLQPLVLDHRLPEHIQDGAATVAGSTDLLDAMRGLAGIVMAAKDAAACAKAAEEAVKAVLLEAMLDTGAGTLRLPHHTISLVDGKANFTITDPAQIPPSLLRQPPPEPDRNAIQKLLNAKQPVPGCERTNGAPHIRIQANQGVSA